MLDVIQKKHKDRYRIQFCNEDFYSAHQNTFKVWQKRLEGLTEVEKLQAWVVGLSCLRRSNDWYGGPRRPALRAMSTMSSLTDNNSAHKKLLHSLSLGELFEGTPVVIPSKLSTNLNIFDFINCHRIKALPESCFRSLCFMVDRKYPLKISSGVVSPFDLLQIQLSGERIVSIDEDFESWPSRLYSGRDFLGFVLHDLIHADHFFRESQHRDGQLGFFRFVSAILDEPILNEMLEGSAEFKAGFEYIISDMNSHPLHLFQTLHSMLFINLKDDARAVIAWQNWIIRIQSLDINATEVEAVTSALLKINSLKFCFADAQTIETFSRNFAKA